MAIRVERLAGGQMFRHYDDVTFETIRVEAPVWFDDDFNRQDLMISEGGSQGIWGSLIVGSGAVSLVDTQNDSNARVALDATDEAQDSVLDMDDRRVFDVGKNFGCEFKLTITSASMTTDGIRLVAGMAGDHALGKDALLTHAWFSMDATLVLDVETDDTTNDTNATGDTTWVTTESHILRIEFYTLSDVRFYLDGANYELGTTFDMSNLTAAEEQMQPYFSLDKAGGVDLCLLDIDYFRCWGTR